MPLVVDRPNVRDSGTGLDGVCQVVLFNDNHNSFDHVILSLMTVFRHGAAVAKKVALEAHKKGKAIAEVEDSEKAHQHKEMLGQLGLMAEVEKI